MSEAVAARTALESAMAALRPLPRPERLARVSLWTMYYFSALVVPAVALTARRGRAPALAIDDLRCDRDADGHVVGFRERHGAQSGSLDGLVKDHLNVVVEHCDRLCGFPKRVAWSNAAVVVDYALAEARAAGDCDAAAIGEAEAMITGAGPPAMAHPYGLPATRERRVCCLRYLLPEGTPCPEICPRLRRVGEPRQSAIITSPSGNLSSEI